MRSEIVQRDYADLWPKVVDARFRTPQEREAVFAMFSTYDGPEADRVRLGVLKAADCNLEKMKSLLEVARSDWRDLLCEAEYPLSSRKWGLKDKSPDRYEKLLEKEQAEYEAWLRQVLAT